MSKYRITVDIEIDDAALAEVTDDKGPPRDVADWYGHDLVAALDQDIAEIQMEPVHSMQELDDDWQRIEGDPI